jgi:hypothetical protein
VFEGKLILMGGYDNTSAWYNDVWSSSDGVTWTQVIASAAFSPRAFHSAVVYNNRIWITGGFDGVNNLADVWYTQ